MEHGCGSKPGLVRMTGFPRGPHALRGLKSEIIIKMEVKIKFLMRKYQLDRMAHLWPESGFHLGTSAVKALPD